jgi:hypothetical protein
MTAIKQEMQNKRAGEATNSSAFYLLKQKPIFALSHPSL